MTASDHRAAILGVLAQNQRGLPDRAIARLAGLNVAETKRALQQLASEGAVGAAGGRWRALGTIPAEPARQAPAPRTIVKPPEGLGIIRRVCSFHADVVHEIASNKLAIERGDQRLQEEITAPVNWFELSKGSASVLRKDLPSPTWGAKGNRSVFAGPMHLVQRRKRGRDQRIWLPVFLIHAHTQRHADRIEFRLDGSVQVNMEWLEHHFAGAEEDLRDDFLIRVGLLREDQGGATTILEQSNFETCWEALKANGSEFEWQEERDLRTPSQARDFDNTAREGLYSRVLLLTEEISSFNRGLVKDLREIAKATDEQLSKTALVPLMGLAADVSNRREEEENAPVVAASSPLNPSQLEAVRTALAEPLVVIQGPPGNGKSTVVRNVLLTLGVNRHSALFGSMNHRAVDAVVKPMNLGLEDRCLVADLRPSDQKSRWVPQLLQNYNLAREGAAELVIELRAELRRIERDLEACMSELRAAFALADELSEVNELIRARREGPMAAIEAPCSEMQWPLPLEKAKWLAQSGLRFTLHPARVASFFARRRLLRSIQGQVSARLEIDCEVLLELARWCELLDRLAEVEGRIQNSDQPAAIEDKAIDLLDRQLSSVVDALPELPTAWADTIREEAGLLTRLRTEARGGSRAGRQRERALEVESLGDLLPGMPLWAITSLSANRAVPRVAGAFDLAIIDEAGQCHPASALPMLFRAKRAMFVGDPKQLPPISGIAVQKEELIRRKYGLEGQEFSRFGFSRRSAYDMAEDALIAQGGNSGMLREHYRCHPAIAEFFNHEFYDGSLLLRTSYGMGGDWEEGIRWTHVPGGSTTHNSSRWHAPQVDAVVQGLQDLAQRGFEGSVGVVTPFNEQAKRIRDAAHSALGAVQMKKWDFISETADGFQGGERDLILFGLVGGGDVKHATPPFYLRQRNRFNVAISRARILLHVFGDIEWAKTCEVPVLNRLALASMKSREAPEGDVRTELIGPVWEPALAEALRAAGLEFRQQYPTCGFHLDFALFPNDGRKLNIEVDGETYHRDRDGNLREEDLRRDLVLRANGWTVLRYWVYELREDMEACIHRIKSLMSQQ